MNLQLILYLSIIMMKMQYLSINLLLITVLSVLPVSSAVACQEFYDLIDEVTLLRVEFSNCPAGCSLNQLLNEVECLKTEYEKALTGNASAGRRAIAIAINIKDDAQELRICIAPVCRDSQSTAANVKHFAQQLRLCLAQTY